MKIAYVINSLEAGGAQFPIPEVFRVLKANGVEVKLFALSRRNGKAIPVFEAAEIDWQCFEGSKTQHIKAAFWLQKRLKTYRPDFIWTSLTQATIIGQILGKKLGIPVVSWQHNAFLKPINRTLLSVTKSLSVLWVTDSERVKALTIDRFGFDPKNVLIWPLFSVNPLAPKASAWKAGEVFKIASLGRLHPNKGYDVLIDALALLKSTNELPEQAFQINIAGDGHEAAALKLKAKIAEISELNFMGHVTDPLAFLADHHAYIQPSRCEGLGIAAHEAMQASLPVLCSRTGQMELTVQDSISGWHCDPGDPACLARALKTMLLAPEKTGLMQSAALSDVSRAFAVENFETAGAVFVTRLRTLLKKPSNNPVFKLTNTKV